MKDTDPFVPRTVPDGVDASLLRDIETHAVEVAARAGHILVEHFHRPLDVQFKTKGSQDPVTIADHSSDEYLKTAIRAKFPEHNIISEEGEVSGASHSSFVWVLDPLDGTVNFMNGLPLFAVSVGVLWNDQPVVGSIYVPVSHNATAGVYHARVGGGAYLDGEEVHVSRSPSGRPLSAMPIGGRLHLSGQSKREPHEARNIGSMAAELAFTACGVFQYAWFGRPRIWDVAAGVLLVSEAGGLSLGRRRGGAWLPLHRFRSAQVDGQGWLEELRGWSRPVIAGTPDVTRRVAKDVRGVGTRPDFFSWVRGPGSTGRRTRGS